MIDCFKGILMTHDSDIFESGKKLGLNGLKPLHSFVKLNYRLLHIRNILFVFSHCVG